MSLYLKKFLTGEVPLSLLNIQMVALDMMVLSTPPETILKHEEAMGGGKKQESHKSCSAQGSKRQKVLSMGKDQQHHRMGLF